MYTTRTTLENTNLWRLDSLGHGAAYEMTDKANGFTRACQDWDAEAFGTELGEMRELHANPTSIYFNMTWDQCLAFMWDKLAP